MPPKTKAPVRSFGGKSAAPKPSGKKSVAGGSGSGKKEDQDSVPSPSSKTPPAEEEEAPTTISTPPKEEEGHEAIATAVDETATAGDAQVQSNGVEEGESEKEEEDDAVEVTTSSSKPAEEPTPTTTAEEKVDLSKEEQNTDVSEASNYQQKDQTEDSKRIEEVVEEEVASPQSPPQPQETATFDPVQQNTTSAQEHRVQQQAQISSNSMTTNSNQVGSNVVDPSQPATASQLQMKQQVGGEEERSPSPQGEGLPEVRQRVVIPPEQAIDMAVVFTQGAMDAACAPLKSALVDADRSNQDVKQSVANGQKSIEMMENQLSQVEATFAKLPKYTEKLVKMKKNMATIDFNIKKLRQQAMDIKTEVDEVMAPKLHSVNRK